MTGISFFTFLGSRDSTIALWRFPNNQDDIIVCSHSNRLVKCGSSNGPLSGGYVGHPYSAPLSYYGCSYPSSRPIESKKLQRFDKVRALTYNYRREVSECYYDCNFFEGVSGTNLRLRSASQPSA